MQTKISKTLWCVFLVVILMVTGLPQTVKANEIPKIGHNESTEDALLLEDFTNLEVQFFGSDSYTSVTQNVYLPTNGKRGSSISWASSDNAVISNTGIVTRSKTEDKFITLTATLVKGDKTSVKSFNLVVIKQQISVPQVMLTESFVVTKGDKVNLSGYIYSDSLINTITVDISDGRFSSSKITISPMDYVYDLSKISLNTTEAVIISGNTYSIRVWVKTQNYQEDKVLATAKLVVLPREIPYEIIGGPQRDIYYYNQGDKGYQSHPYGELTLGEIGSGPAAMAMVISSLTDQLIDPVVMANWSVDNKHVTKYYGANTSFISASANAYNLSTENLNFYYSNDGLAKKITQALLEGKMVVALLKPTWNPTFGQTKDQYIVMRGINEDGKILVADPTDDATRSRSKKSSGYDLWTILRECKTNVEGGGPLWIISSKEPLPKLTGLAKEYTLNASGKLTLPGLVTAQTNLTNVTLVIANVSNGKVTGDELKYTVAPNNRSYDLRNIGLNTSGLRIGNYRIRVWATSSGDVRNHAMIYEGLLSVTEKTDQMLNQDFDKLAIGYVTGDNSYYVTNHITLPTKGEKGSSITWNSSNSNVIQVMNNGIGIVYRPTLNTNVTLTATLRNGNMTRVKTFQLTVAGLQTITLSGLKSNYDVSYNGKITLSGVVQSSAMLTKVWITIDGYDKYFDVKWPNSYSYNLNNITIDTKDPALMLSPGTYNINVYVTDSKSTDGRTAIGKATLNVTSKHWKKAWWDRRNIKLYYAKGDSWKKITKNINLPSTGWYGSIITWKSTNEKIISSTGVVIRPKKDTKVTLVATITLGDVTITRDIVLTVKAANNKKEKVVKGHR